MDNYTYPKYTLMSHNIYFTTLHDHQFITYHIMPTIKHKTIYTLRQHCYTKIMDKVISVIFANIATAIIYLFNGIDAALICLIIAIILDYISGIIKAYNTKELSSSIGLKGILKKVGILCIVALSVLVDRITGETGAIRTLVIYYFVANEGLSIIENLAVAGVPIPASLKKALKAIKKGNK